VRPPSKSSLFAAAKRRDAAAVKAILAAAPDLVAARDPKGRLALHLACAVRPGGPRVLAALPHPFIARLSDPKRRTAMTRAKRE